MIKSLIILFLVLIPSGLRVGSQLYFYEVILFLLVILLVFKKRNKTNSPYPYIKWIVIFLSVIILTMYFRGLGFQALGDAKIGGMFYVKLIFSLIFVLLAKKITLSEKQWKSALLGATALSFLPFISDLVYLFNGGFTFFNELVQGSTTIEENLQYLDRGSMFRLQSAAVTAQYLFIFALITFPLKNVKGNINFKIIISIVVCFVLAGVSGHRLAFVNIVLLFIIYIVLQENNINVIRHFAGGMIIIAMVLAAIIIGFDYLPISFQRSLSFLPFVKVSEEATRDAVGSWEFRFAMWGIGVTQIPDYWLLGKGFAATPMLLNENNSLDTMNWFIEMGTYHNGLLGLLLNFGIFGLISGLTILVSSVKSLKVPARTWISKNWLYRYYIVAYASLILAVFGYIFFYGDVQTNYPEIILSIAALEIFIRSLKRETIVK